MSAAVQCAALRAAIPAPRRGSTSRDTTNQINKPATSDGSRIHVDAVDTRVINAKKS